MKSLNRRDLIQSFGIASAVTALHGGWFSEPVWIDRLSASEAGTKLAEAAAKSTRVKTVVELSGTVKLKDYNKNNGESDPQSVPIQAKTTLEYEEQFYVDRKSTELSGLALQNFLEAKSESVIGKQANEIQLSEQSRVIARSVDDSGAHTAALAQPLTRPEKDLVEGPIATLYLDLLMPGKGVRKGESWPLSMVGVQRLLHLDAVSDGGITVQLMDADEETGQLEIKGQVSGEIQGVKTNIDLNGTAKVNRRQGIVSWLAVSVKEDRNIGEAEPGFQITARLRILRESVASLKSPFTIQDAETAFSGKRTSADVLRFVSRLGAYQFVADNRWHLYSDTGVDSTLRWINRNRRIAQCNITNLTDTEPGKQLSIEGYQSDIARSLGKQFAQFVTRDERLTDQGLRLMRVVSSGKHEGVALHWIHMLISNDAGRHLAMVFVMNAEHVEEFGGSDLQIADTFEFTMRQLPTLPEEKKDSTADSTSEKPDTKSAAKPAATR